MMDYTILARVRLTSKHRQTGFTRHYLNGNLQGVPASLEIMQYENDHGFYLLYFDAEHHRMNDTLHDTLEQAYEQAELEFCVEAGDWETV